MKRYLKEFSDEQIKKIGEKRQGLRFDNFKVGDSISVVYKIVDEVALELISRKALPEDFAFRTQTITGMCIAKKSNGFSSTFTLLHSIDPNSSYERIFPVYSPLISGIEVNKSFKVRRAKLYYLTKLYGKAARLKEIPSYKKKEVAAKV